jgi:hypothetical protein
MATSTRPDDVWIWTTQGSGGSALKWIAVSAPCGARVSITLELTTRETCRSVALTTPRPIRSGEGEGTGDRDRPVPETSGLIEPDAPSGVAHPASTRAAPIERRPNATRQMHRLLCDMFTPRLSGHVTTESTAAFHSTSLDAFALVKFRSLPVGKI